MQARSLTIRLIRLAMAASIILPGLLFAFGSWTTYHNIHALADERLARSLDVQREEATKTFALVDLTMSNSLDLVAGMSAPDISQNSERLHFQLKKYTEMVAPIQSIWIYDANSRALVTSRVHPPPSQAYSDRDFFQAHMNGDGATYYGQVYTSSFTGEPFFTVSQSLSMTVNSLVFLKCRSFRVIFLDSFPHWPTPKVCSMRWCERTVYF